MDINLSTLVTGREVSLKDMLDAREHRQEVQRMLLSEHHLPVISFTLNIVGPVKVFPLALRTFHEGIRLIETQCHAWKIPIIATYSTTSHTGHEYFWAVDGDVRFIKEHLCLLEDSVALGRLFDIDVIQTDGMKISRTDLGFSTRKCLICNQEAFVCSRARTHSVKELLEQECQIMTNYFAKQHARKLSSLSMQALVYEVSVTPKPGLVDRNNTGAHQDMDIFTFEASAVSLNHYFEQFALCGIENGHEPFSRIFSRLRSLGYMYANHIPYSPDALLKINRKLVADVLEDFNDVTVENARTNGERLYALYGMKGARGEALSGYHTVLKKALPVLKHQLDRGLSLNDAGAVTLLYIMAHSEDTNIVNRSSYHSMKKIQALLRETLNDPEFINKDPIPYIESLDREFIKNNISPGGSADLLALTFFLYLFENSGLSSIL